MSEEHATDGTTAMKSALAADSKSAPASAGKPGFIRRYRLPLFLAVVAICLYAGSILYILYGRGQVI